MSYQLKFGFRELLDIPVVQLNWQQQQAVVSLYGGHVLSWFDGHIERLWLSPLAKWQGQAIRGGVPICWPWFGPFPTELAPQVSNQPNHGLVRTRFWHFETATETDAGLEVRFSIRVTDIPWQQGQAITLQLRVALSMEGLRIQLHCSDALVQQAALHSYFPVEDLAASSVFPLPSHYHDKVLGRTVGDAAQAEVESHCSFNGEIDRVYLKPASRLQLAGPSIQTICQQGHDASVVWNPGSTRAASLADVGDGYSEFVCVESAKLAYSAEPLDLVQQLLR